MGLHAAIREILGAVFFHKKSLHCLEASDIFTAILVKVGLLACFGVGPEKGFLLPGEK